MCDCDLDRPEVWEEAKRKARKQHTCCECDHPINPGAEHLWMKGLWKWGWCTYKMCLECEAVAKAADVERCHEIGGLYECLIEGGTFYHSEEVDDVTWFTDEPWKIVSQNPLKCIVVGQEAA